MVDSLTRAIGTCACFVLMLGGTCVTAAGAQRQARGRLIERTTIQQDSAQQFAVYLPAGYDRARKWPVIFIMDPRGRALLALELFTSAADRLGYVLVSSYNTLSDGPLQPNVDAINAMLAAVQQTIAADLSRLYIAGFSGTARVGWAFAREAPANFAGLLSAGAAPIAADSEFRRALKADGFALVMTAGSADFNHTEVHTVANRLMRLGLPVRTVYFDGPHGWPPAATIDRVIDWFEASAMASGRARLDSAWIDAHFESELRGTDSLRKIQQTAAAADRCAEVATQLERFTTAERLLVRARACADSLGALQPVRRLEARAAALEQQELEVIATIAARLTNVSLATDPRDLSKRLGLADLVRAAQSGDSLERPWAARTLAWVQVTLGFYEPRAALERGDPDRALVLLRTWATAGTLNAQHCATVHRAEDLIRQRGRNPGTDSTVSRTCPRIDRPR